MVAYLGGADKDLYDEKEVTKESPALRIGQVAAVALGMSIILFHAPAVAAEPSTVLNSQTLSAYDVSRDGVRATSEAKVSVKETRRTQRALKKLGFVSVRIDGENSQEFKNILCAWREIAGRKVTRQQLKPQEVDAIKSMQSLPKPKDYMVTGLNVNRQCQSVALVVKNKGKPRKYDKVFRASTGKAGYTTTAGNHVIQRRINGKHTSTSYPSSSWNMYRPAYFTSWGEAFHGSPSDTSVAWSPSSNGCVRMLQKDIDYLWATGANNIGTKVYIYGTWVW